MNRESIPDTVLLRLVEAHGFRFSRRSFRGARVRQARRRNGGQWLTVEDLMSLVTRACGSTGLHAKHIRHR